MTLPCLKGINNDAVEFQKRFAIRCRHKRGSKAVEEISYRKSHLCCMYRADGHRSVCVCGTTSAHRFWWRTFLARAHCSLRYPNSGERVVSLRASTIEIRAVGSMAAMWWLVAGSLMRVYDVI